MRRLTMFVFIVVAVSALQTARAGIGQSVDARASAVLQKAQAALGGTAALTGVTRLAADGEVVRWANGSATKGRMQIVLELPDSFRRTEEWTQGGILSSHTEALNGSEVSERVEEQGQQAVSKGRRKVGPPNGGTSDDVQKVIQARLRAELERYLLGWLGHPAGEQSYDGQTRTNEGIADVVTVRTERGDFMQLFVRSADGIPIKLAYQGGGARAAWPGAIHSLARGEDQYEIVFSDYRVVGVLKLPHRLAFMVNSALLQEWTIDRFE